MYIYWIIGGEFDFDVNYQCGYVWGYEEQQVFLNVVIFGFFIGLVVLVKVFDWCLCEFFYIEVVDGKQCFIILKKFIINEILIILVDGLFYW